MESNLIEDSVQGKDEAVAARGQHVKVEHRLQLNDQMYCK